MDIKKLARLSCIPLLCLPIAMLFQNCGQSLEAGSATSQSTHDSTSAIPTGFNIAEVDFNVQGLEYVIVGTNNGSEDIAACTQVECKMLFSRSAMLRQLANKYPVAYKVSLNGLYFAIRAAYKTNMSSDAYSTFHIFEFDRTAVSAKKILSTELIGPPNSNLNNLNFDISNQGNLAITVKTDDEADLRIYDIRGNLQIVNANTQSDGSRIFAPYQYVSSVLFNSSGDLALVDGNSVALRLKRLTSNRYELFDSAWIPFEKPERAIGESINVGDAYLGEDMSLVIMTGRDPVESGGETYGLAISRNANAPLTTIIDRIGSGRADRFRGAITGYIRSSPVLTWKNGKFVVSTVKGVLTFDTLSTPPSGAYADYPAGFPIVESSAGGQLVTRGVSRSGYVLFKDSIKPVPYVE